MSCDLVLPRRAYVAYCNVEGLSPSDDLARQILIFLFYGKVEWQNFPELFPVFKVLQKMMAAGNYTYVCVS